MTLPPNEIVASLRGDELARLLITARSLRDERRMLLTPAERERDARSELEMIVTSLRADELTRLVQIAGALMQP